MPENGAATKDPGGAGGSLQPCQWINHQSASEHYKLKEVNYINYDYVKVMFASVSLFSTKSTIN